MVTVKAALTSQFPGEHLPTKENFRWLHALVTSTYFMFGLHSMVGVEILCERQQAVIVVRGGSSVEEMEAYLWRASRRYFAGGYISFDGCSGMYVVQSMWTLALIVRSLRRRALPSPYLLINLRLIHTGTGEGKTPLCIRLVFTVKGIPHSCVRCPIVYRLMFSWTGTSWFDFVN